MIGRLAFLLFCLLPLLHVVMHGVARAQTEPFRQIEVTTLADDGPGSLRQALLETGPRHIVFKVGGEIWLKSTILVRNAYAVVDGATAPSPGISLMGDRAFRIRTHDVTLRHLRVRVGALESGMDPQNRDGISIDGSSDGREPARRVLIEHCSFAWSIDELAQVWGSGTHDVVIRNSIFAEGLNKSIHPKGYHSMAMVVGPNTRNVTIRQNLFAHNAFRNPVLAGGSHSLVENNIIYNPMFAAIHFYPSRDAQPTVANLIGNVVIAGPNTRPRLSMFSKGLNPQSEIYLRDNLSIGTEAFNAAASSKLQNPPILLDMPSPRAPHPDAHAAAHLESWLLDSVGARPEDRDETDARIINEVRHRKGQIRDQAPDQRLWSVRKSDDPRKP